MKKVLLGLLCLALVMSSCEIPQSITIKGNPGLSISLGNVFENSDNKLEDYLDLDEIKKMMGGDNSDINIYDYEVNGFYDNIQSYLIHYPIAKMELDLSEYVSDAMLNNSTSASAEIPAIVDNYGGPFPAGGLFLSGTGVDTSEGDPLFTVSFGDMAKMVIEVNGTFGLEFSNYSSAFAENVYIKMSAFGLTDYQKGTETDGKLRFVNPGKTQFIPQTDLDNGNLEIYVKVMGACSGTITPELVFDWTTAKIDTTSLGNDNLKGEYLIDNILGDFLGGNIAFKEVRGYIYVDGIDELGATVTMTIGIKDGDTLGSGNLTSSPKPIFSDPVTSALPTPSLGDSFIDLSLLLNASSASTLEYDVKIPEITITNTEFADSGKTISFDLVIVFPLALTVSAPLDVDNSVFPDADKYVKLDMGDVFDFGTDSDSDLFGRTGDDDLLNNITSLKITLEDFQNDIIDANIGILLTAPYPDGSGKPDFYTYVQLASNGSLEITDIGELNPFIPSFEIILKKDEKLSGGFEDYATFAVKRLIPNPKFDFSLTLSASVNIDYTISLD